jgi:drug/metabolite transporter (DMT)-like permease
MATAYILGALSVLFLALAAVRLARPGGQRHPQTRTWLIIGLIFGAVSAWLFYQSHVPGLNPPPFRR